MQRLERPEAERIDGIPPAIAVTGKNTSRSSRSTVGTATETNDYLRLLFAKIGHTFCRQCGREVRCESPQSAAETLAALPPGTHYMIAFACPLPNDGTIEQVAAALREDGFVRAISMGGWSIWTKCLLQSRKRRRTRLFTRSSIDSPSAARPIAGCAIRWKRRL